MRVKLIATVVVSAFCGAGLPPALARSQPANVVALRSCAVLTPVPRALLLTPLVVVSQKLAAAVTEVPLRWATRPPMKRLLAPAMPVAVTTPVA